MFVNGFFHKKQKYRAKYKAKKPAGSTAAVLAGGTVSAAPARGFARGGIYFAGITSPRRRAATRADDFFVRVFDEFVENISAFFAFVFVNRHMFYLFLRKFPPFFLGFSIVF